MRRARGFTLIELIVFIVVAGVIAVALVQVFGGTMSGAHKGKELAVAAGLAQERMELILGQRRRTGAVFTTFVDPCPTAAVACTSPTGYTVSAAIADNSAECTGVATVDCRRITVTVTGPDGSQVAQLVSRVMNY